MQFKALVKLKEEYEKKKENARIGFCTRYQKPIIIEALITRLSELGTDNSSS